MDAKRFAKGFGKAVIMKARRLRLGLWHVHPTFYMGRGCRVSRDFRAGPHSFMNEGCIIGPKVELGAYALLGPQVAIVGDDHVFDRVGIPINFSGRPALRRPTRIGADAWIGCRAIIMAGVTIGDCAIVAAGAVVTRDVEPNTVVAGVPARVVRRRFEDEDDWKRHRAAIEAQEICSGGHNVPPLF